MVRLIWCKPLSFRKDSWGVHDHHLRTLVIDQLGFLCTKPIVNHLSFSGLYRSGRFNQSSWLSDCLLPRRSFWPSFHPSSCRFVFVFVRSFFWTYTHLKRDLVIGPLHFVTDEDSSPWGPDPLFLPSVQMKSVMWKTWKFYNMVFIHDG